MIGVGIYRANGASLITMEQAKPEFEPFEGDVDSLAASMGMKDALALLTLHCLYPSIAPAPFSILLAMANQSSRRSLK